MSDTPAAPAPVETKAPVAETPAPAAPAEPKVEPKAPESREDLDKKVGSRFAALSRKEREVLNAQKANKAQSDVLAKREAELKALEAKFSKKPTTPIEALEAAGFTYEQATAFMLNGKETPIDQRVADLQKRLDDAEAARAKEAQDRLENERQSAQTAKEQSMQQWRDSVAEECKKNEKFEYLNWAGRYDLVTSVIEEHYNLTSDQGEPKIMSTEEAAEKVEAWLEQQTAAEFEKLAALKKWQAKVKPPAEKQPEGVSSSDDEMDKIVGALKQTRTLTNSHKPSPAVTPKKKMTEKERFDLAMKALDNLG